MSYPILNMQEFQGYVFNNTGDLSIVYEGPSSIKCKAPHPITAEAFERISSWGLGNRLSSIHVVCPHHREPNKDKYPLRELRWGWARVRAELAGIVPSVKRVLLISQSSLLTQVVMPGVPGLADTHGSIFTLDNGLEVVPTWIKCYEHMRHWRDRDIERFKYVVKGEPLPYYTDLGLMAGDMVAVDLETTGLDCTKDTITVLGVQWGDTQRAEITGEDNIRRGIQQLTNCVKNETHVTFHNGQFDLGFMGQRFRNAVIDNSAVHCTLIRSRSRGELVSTLKHLGNTYTDRPGNYSWASSNKDHIHDFTDPTYVAEDLDVTWQLGKLFADDGKRPVVQQFEKCIVMAVEQTIHGTFIDRPKLETLYEEGKINIARLEAECIQEYGVEPNKTKEMVAVLLLRGHELTKKTPSGAFALDEDVCIEHGLHLILEYRRACKLDNSFVGKIRTLLRPDGTLPHYQSMLGADTGRTTMSNFNHQQAARKGPVRGLVISRFKGGSIGIVDLAQAELRVLAYISDDEVFAEAFKSEDLHKTNASRAFGVEIHKVTKEQRHDAKTVVFRIIYGGKAQNPGQVRVEMYFKGNFIKSFKWLEFTKMIAKKQLFIEDPYGKVRNLSEVKTWRGMGGVGRAGINSPIQGVASHIAMQITYFAWELFRKYKLQSKVLFGVHDSVVTDINPDETHIASQLIRLAFAKLRDTQLYIAFPLAKILPMQGELVLGPSWGWIDDEDNKHLQTPIICSSHDTITEDDVYGF